MGRSGAGGGIQESEGGSFGRYGIGSSEGGIGGIESENFGRSGADTFGRSEGIGQSENVEAFGNEDRDFGGSTGTGMRSGMGSGMGTGTGTGTGTLGSSTQRHTGSLETAGLATAGSTIDHQQSTGSAKLGTISGMDSGKRDDKSYGSSYAGAGTSTGTGLRSDQPQSQQQGQLQQGQQGQHHKDSGIGKLMEKAGGLLHNKSLEERGHERRERASRSGPSGGGH